MGTISEKLTYLNETKGLLKDNINLTGAGLTNQTPFRQYATDLKTALLNILNNGIDTLYNNFPKTTGTGTNITLNNTLQAPMRSVINGDTEQESYSGKNLLNAKDYLYGTSNGIKTTYENNSYVLNGTASASWCYIANNVPINLSEGTYTLSITKALTHRIYITFKFEDNSTGTLAINAGNTSASYTINKKVVSYELSCANMTSGTTYNETIGIQLEQGSATSYEPYVGGTASPNPDYPQEIKSVTGLQKVSVEGKNLLDDSKNTNNYYINASGNITPGENFAYTTLIPVEQTIYIFSSIQTTLNLTNNKRIHGYDKNGNWIEQITYSTITTGNTSQDYSITFTINNSNIKYVRISYFKSDTNSQLEKGSTATEYEPYQGQEYEINLGKNLLKFPYAESSLTRDGITYTINNDGSISISGTATATSYINLYSNLSTNLLEKGKTYTYSISPENSNIRLTILERYNNTWNDNGFGTNKITFTISNNSEGQLIRLIVTNGSTINTTISPQIEKGNEATSYSPYFTPIHLYENDQIIGTPNNWSVKHVMSEVVLDGSENWNITQNNSVLYVTNIEDYAVSNNIPYSNYFQGIDNVDGAGVMSSKNENTMAFINNHTNYRLYIKKTTFASASDFKTWLSTHNTKVVYELAEPTTTPITNTELIEDLNNFYNAKSYNGQTNISVDGDLQMILDVSAIIDE